MINQMNQMQQEIDHYDSELLRKEKVLEEQSNRIEELEDLIAQNKNISEMEEGPLKKELEGAYNSIREQQKQLEEYQRVS